MVSCLFIVIAVSSVTFLSTKVNPADTESVPINDGFKIRKKRQDSGYNCKCTIGFVEISSVYLEWGCGLDCAECSNAIFTPTNITGYVDATANAYYGIDSNGCRTFRFVCSDPTNLSNTVQISFDFAGIPLYVVVIGIGNITFPLTCADSSDWWDGSVIWPIDQFPLMCSEIYIPSSSTTALLSTTSTINTTTTSTVATPTPTTTTAIATSLITTTTISSNSTTCCTSTGTWSAWTATTTTCNNTCGACSSITSTRTCISLANNCPCSGNSTKTDPCNIGTCSFPHIACCFTYVPMIINGSHACGPMPNTTDTPASTVCL